MFTRKGEDSGERSGGTDAALRDLREATLFLYGRTGEGFAGEEDSAPD